MYKANKPFQVNVGKFVTITTPNLNELRSMYKFLTGNLDSEHHGVFDIQHSRCFYVEVGHFVL